MCPECSELYHSWLRWLTEQGPITGWRHYPPANGNEHRVARDAESRRTRQHERIDLVREQTTRIARTCREHHQHSTEKAAR